MKLFSKQPFLILANPEIARQWHPTKNGDLTARHVTAGSNKKVWWLGDCGHEWMSTVNNRIYQKVYNCPYCTRRMVCLDNCLATTHPEIARQWHPTKNGDLTAKHVTAGSNKKVWWLGDCGHEWGTIIRNRTSIKTGCPYCFNGGKFRNRRMVCLDNCLATTHPEIARQWHPTKNGDFTSIDVLSGSSKKVWWLCNRKHEYECVVNKQTGGRGCPYCNNKAVCLDNCLATTHPEIARQWHPTKNGDFTAKHVTAGSEKKVWWLGDCRHEWKTSVCKRKGGRGCPLCKQSYGEKEIEKSLIENKIQYEREYRFDECKNKSRLPFDFVIFIGKKIGCIEYQGVQHFMPIEHFGGKIRYEKINKTDKIKNDFCTNKKLPLLIIPYTDFNNITKLILNFIRFWW